MTAPLAFHIYAPHGPTTTNGRRKRHRVTVPCACGGSLRADPRAEGSVTWAIEHHQRTDRHVLWRERFEEGGVFVIGRVVVTPEGTFLEPVG